ncbi:hypothetical protein HYC85_013199 [Camellia sinensis]|uniref:Uncharacterized protein n=1 Tax=Camellia sinensis TaxID=4442 RepID=A0A7J7H2Q3_CAMSI|nr:hypothetical protein HYC85_013199 [Camellia sinensis]
MAQSSLYWETRLMTYEKYMMKEVGIASSSILNCQGLKNAFLWLNLVAIKDLKKVFYGLTSWPLKRDSMQKANKIPQEGELKCQIRQSRNISETPTFQKNCDNLNGQRY